MSMSETSSKQVHENEWMRYYSEDGYPYYYNATTNVSMWEYEFLEHYNSLTKTKASAKTSKDHVHHNLDYDLQKAAIKIQSIFRKFCVQKVVCRAITNYEAICLDVEKAMKDFESLYSVDFYGR